MIAVFPAPRNIQLNGETPRMFGYGKEPYRHPESEWGSARRRARPVAPQRRRSRPRSDERPGRHAGGGRVRARAGSHGRVVYTGLNNTNPALADSPQRRAITDAGAEVAHEGMRIQLSTPEGRPGAATISPFCWRTTATS